MLSRGSNVSRNPDIRFGHLAATPRPDFSDATAEVGIVIRAELTDPALTVRERDRLDRAERLHSLRYWGY